MGKYGIRGHMQGFMGSGIIALQGSQKGSGITCKVGIRDDRVGARDRSTGIREHKSVVREHSAGISLREGLEGIMVTVRKRGTLKELHM